MISIIYHSADLDGHCSGAIARRHYEETGLKINVGFKMIPLNYGDPVPWDELKGSHIVMMDFSLLPWSDMERLIKEAKTFTWIDHHKNAISDFRDSDIFSAANLKTSLDPTKAACELAWDWFYGGPMPRGVQLLGRYDVWDLDWHEDVLPFQMGCRIMNLDPANDSAMRAWDIILGRRDSFIAETVKEGVIILAYQDQQNKRILANGHEVFLTGFRFLAVNAGGLNSIASRGFYDPKKHQGFMTYFRKGPNKWTISLYSPDQSRDLSGIAKRYGGGGHPCACGFQVDDLEMIKILRGMSDTPAFLTGSRVYGEPRDDSDIDLVVLASALDINILASFTEGDWPCIRFGNINIIPTSSEKEYITWKKMTEWATEQFKETHRPVSKYEATEYRDALCEEMGVEVKHFQSGEQNNETNETNER